jgi:hypothetical protein
MPRAYVAGRASLRGARERGGGPPAGAEAERRGARTRGEPHVGVTQSALRYRHTQTHRSHSSRRRKEGGRRGARTRAAARRPHLPPRRRPFPLPPRRRRHRSSPAHTRARPPPRSDIALGMKGSARAPAAGRSCGSGWRRGGGGGGRSLSLPLLPPSPSPSPSSLHSHEGRGAAHATQRPSPRPRALPRRSAGGGRQAGCAGVRRVVGRLTRRAWARGTWR